MQGWPHPTLLSWHASLYRDLLQCIGHTSHSVTATNWSWTRHRDNTTRGQIVEKLIPFPTSIPDLWSEIHLVLSSASASASVICDGGGRMSRVICHNMTLYTLCRVLDSISVSEFEQFIYKWHSLMLFFQSQTLTIISCWEPTWKQNIWWYKSL